MLELILNALMKAADPIVKLNAPEIRRIFNSLKYLLLLLLCYSINAQSISVRYVVADVIITQPVKEQYRELSKLANGMTFTLKFNSVRQSFIGDDASIMAIDNNSGSDLARILFASTYDYWFDWKENNVLKKDPQGDLIQDKIKNPVWEIASENKIIDGYKCYKAITYYEYVSISGNPVRLTISAWFAPEIPYPIGPMDYNGLPGLVLELHDGRATRYLAEKIEILGDSIDIDWPKGKTISTEAYKKGIENSPALNRK